MKVKVKNINVALNPQFIMWEVDLANIVRDTSLQVSDGCIALYVVNGMLQSINTPGQWVINTKEEEKSGAKLRLIAVNSDKLYSILCGVGGVPYKDWELNLETQVGAHGTCRFRIINAWAIYTALGKTNVTVDDIDDYIKPQLIEVIRVQLANVLQKYDFSSVQTQVGKMSKDLSDLMVDRFAPLGIEIENFSLEEIFFNEEYKQKRAAAFEYENDMKKAKEMKRERERALRAQAELYTSIKNVVGDGDVEEALEFINRGIICPVCGAKNDIGASVCSKCGKAF